MDCNQAQDRLLSADIVEPLTGDHDLDAHIQSCPTCRTLLAGLRRLEAAARDLPTVPDAEITRQRFLQLLASSRSADLRGRIFRLPRAIALPTRRIAMAALILLATGLVFWAVWFQGAQKAAASDALVENLVEWNMRLGSAESSEQRQQIYSSLAPSLQKSVGNVPVNSSDQPLARKLLETAKSLSQGGDPVDDAEQFADVADMLLDRVDAAAGAGNSADIERFSRCYAQVTTEGIAGKLAQAHHSGKVAEFERLSHRDHQLKVRLDKLLEKSPEPTRKQIRRALKGVGHSRHSED